LRRRRIARARKIRAIAKPASGASSSSQRHTLLKIEALHSRASRLADRGNYSAAAQAFRRALRLAAGVRPSNPLLLAALLNDFGVVCKYTGRFAQARRMYLRALSAIRSLDQARLLKAFVATLYHNLAGIEHARRRFKPALRYARRGIAIRNAIRPRYIPALAADEAALAAILVDSGGVSQATTILLRALRRFRRSLGSKHHEAGAVLANLAVVYWKKGRLHVAERTIRRAALILQSALGRNHPRTASALNNLAFICARRGKRAEAAVLYRRVLRILARHPRSAYLKSSVVKQDYAKLLHAWRVGGPPRDTGLRSNHD
jgi:tetratricopeptide (TPR) repeat protein